MPLQSSILGAYQLYTRRSRKSFLMSGYALELFLLIEWNLIRLGGHAHGIVTKTVHKTQSGGEGWWGEGV